MKLNPKTARPIMVPCEGSGGPTHLTSKITGRLEGTCSMCGQRVELNNGDAAPVHDRPDILAMLARGDYDRWER